MDVTVKPDILRVVINHDTIECLIEYDPSRVGAHALIAFATQMFRNGYTVVAFRWGYPIPDIAWSW
jgi:hypothetical protein